MKILYKVAGILYLLSLMSMPTCLHADTFYGTIDLNSKSYPELILNGPANLNEIKTPSLTANGPLNFSSLEVLKTALCNGPVNGANGKFGELIVHGSLKLNTSSVTALEVSGPVSVTDFKAENSTTIKGPLNATKSQFKDISVMGDTSLDNSSANNITFPRTTQPKTLTLSGKTVVSGDISFESGNGEVIVKGNQVEIKGKIVGGKRTNKP